MIQLPEIYKNDKLTRCEEVIKMVATNHYGHTYERNYILAEYKSGKCLLFMNEFCSDNEIKTLEVDEYMLIKNEKHLFFEWIDNPLLRLFFDEEVLSLPDYVYFDVLKMDSEFKVIFQNHLKAYIAENIDADFEDYEVSRIQLFFEAIDGDGNLFEQN
jgi:hypothetical protein